MMGKDARRGGKLAKLGKSDESSSCGCRGSHRAQLSGYCGSHGAHDMSDVRAAGDALFDIPAIVFPIVMNTPVSSAEERREPHARDELALHHARHAVAVCAERRRRSGGGGVPAWRRSTPRVQEESESAERRWF